MTKPNAQYNLAAPDSLASRIAGRVRRQMFERFVQVAKIGDAHTILDVGVTSDRLYDHSNYLESWHPHKHRITATGIDDASFLVHRYPGLAFVRADGRALPFADESFDFVHSSAVIEHVGSRAMQRRFLVELFRVCRCGLFVTTPNQWFPIEFHTILPLVHWLPQRRFQAVLRAIGREFFADEDNLNLLTAADLRRLCAEAEMGDVTIMSARLAGLPSNLLLFARKPPPPQAGAVQAITSRPMMRKPLPTR